MSSAVLAAVALRVITRNAVLVAVALRVMTRNAVLVAVAWAALECCPECGPGLVMTSGVQSITLSCNNAEIEKKEATTINNRQQQATIGNNRQ